MKLTLFFAVAALTTAQRAQAASFLGCMKGSLFASRTDFTIQTDRRACQAYCLSQDFRSHAAGFIGDSSKCFCSLSYDSIVGSAYTTNMLTPGSDSLGNCAASDLSLDGQATAKYPQFTGCFTTRPEYGPLGGASIGASAGINMCPYYVNQARFVSYAFAYVPSMNVPRFQCFAYRDFTLDLSSLVPANCSAENVWLVAVGTPPTNPSLYHKRMNQARKVATRCPSGQKACIVYGTEDHECLEVDEDLESCGGCLYGEYQNNVMDQVVLNQTAIVGTDCTALPGVDAWGVGCARGRCDVQACLEGYTLVDGSCELSQTAGGELVLQP